AMTLSRDTAPEIQGGSTGEVREAKPVEAVGPAPPEANAEPPAAAEAPPAAHASPVRRIVKIVALLLLLLYVYDVIADRITPYTSQATVDTFLVQIAPEITGRVSYVGVTDNSNVR